MYALAIHGGAGARPASPLSLEREQGYTNGLAQAIAAGQAVLERDGSALDAVESAVRVLEDDPHFNAGRGAVLTIDGTAELDAAVMDGEQLRAGAVAAVRTVRNPVQLARRVLEDTPHVFLAGDGAERFAAECGLERVDNQYFLTPERVAQLQRLRERHMPAALEEPPFGTVGAVARDRLGRLAAATSTGGMNGQQVGRVGDSPVIGAGTYADSQLCAISATGHGEWFLRTVQAYDIAARMRYGGASLEQAVEASIMQRMPRLGASGGVIAIDHAGNIVIRYNTPGMFRGYVRNGEAPRIDI
jgi:beta-aspartyl-peptidase (threonine type)